MSHSDPNYNPVFTSIAAQLFVSDINNSVLFYSSMLGFTIDFVYGEPPYYGQVIRDSAKIVLRHIDEAVYSGDVRERECLLSAAITLASAEDAQQLFYQYQSLCLQFQQTLREEPWGASTFIVKDPDGNLILFASPSS